MKEMYEMVCENRKPIKENNRYIISSIKTGEVLNVPRAWVLKNYDHLINVTINNGSIYIVKNKYTECMRILTSRIHHKIRSRWGLRLSLSDLKTLRFNVLDVRDYNRINSKRTSFELLEYLNGLHNNMLETFCYVLSQALSGVYVATLNEKSLVIYNKGNNIYNQGNTFNINADDLILLVKTLVN